MSDGLKLALGGLTVALFSLSGASLLGGSMHWPGVALLGMGVLRAVVWIRQLLFYLRTDDED